MPQRSGTDLSGIVPSRLIKRHYAIHRLIIPMGTIMQTITDTTALGQRLRRERKAQGLTQERG